MPAQDAAPAPAIRGRTVPAQPVGDFPNPEEARRFLRGVINNPANKNRRLWGMTERLVMSVMRHHWDAERKLADLDYIRVQPAPDTPRYNQFRLIKTDGSEDDISITRCITGKPPTARQGLNDALRNAISRRGYTLEPTAGKHGTFRALSDGWMAERGLNISDISLVRKRRAGARCQIADAELEADWVRYYLTQTSGR